MFLIVLFHFDTRLPSPLAHVSITLDLSLRDLRIETVERTLKRLAADASMRIPYSQSSEEAHQRRVKANLNQRRAAHFLISNRRDKITKRIFTAR